MFHKRHVGRPTNQEIRNRKIKKALIITVPVVVVLIAVYAVMKTTNLFNLMGSTVITYTCEGVTCDEGWDLDKEYCICSKETEELVDAYLIGDANNDKLLNSIDFQIMKNDLLNQNKLDEYKKIVYDINQDGKIDDNISNDGEYNTDLKVFIEWISEKNTNYSSYPEKRVCPKNVEGDDKKITYEFDEETKSCKKTTRLEVSKLYYTYKNVEDQKVTYDNSKSSKKPPKKSPTKTNKKSDTIKIVYNSNGGKGSMNDSIIKIGSNTNLRKNSFKKSNNYFTGWRVKRSSDNKWLCYTNQSKSNKSYSDTKICNKNGYVLWNDKHNMSQAKTNVTLYAYWQYNYSSNSKGFSGFELNPAKSKNGYTATIWPVIDLDIYKKSNGTSSTGKKVSMGTALYVLDMTNKNNLNNSYVKIQHGNTTGWINGEYVLINLPDVIPSITYNITNATKSKFKFHGNSLTDSNGKQITNQDIYAGSWYGYNKRLGYNEYLGPVRLQTAKKIQRAQSTALNHHNSLKVYDLFRPYKAQTRVAQGLKKKNFSGKKYCVTNKFASGHNSNGSTRCLNETYGWFIATKPVSHNVGKALDVTLVNSDDKQEIKTQSNMHELSGLSVPTQSKVDEYFGELSLNRLFINSGFDYLISEWWHFEDDGRKSVSGVEKLGSQDKPLKLKYWSN